ncbi:cupin domain-containing protein [Ottowia sp.]|uniref:cupin domain-containing protein n=1 Tax=Ottowia sp. TaxID=1898956 RepID=UPI003A850412
MAQEELSIIAEPRDWLPLALPGTEGVSVKVYKVDEANRTVVLKARFDPGSRMPRHQHHCRAIAYTVSGEWAYDEGSFAPGALAYEMFGNDHIPFSEKGTEMFITFVSDTDQFLDNDLPDGSTLHLGLPWFKALEGATLEQYQKLDQMSLVEIHPKKRIAA